ncbi:dynein beta chain, ciliary-like [Montipora foliosa]|uniref:dynein beta chain, ciliary-like n=1 Tax=Montipora foliosa TaxID=591990 RepID=UPI0035F21CB9
MEQKDNTLICKIRFPVSGKFKHVLFGRSEDTEVDASTYFELCAFIIHCDKPAEDSKALPENTRQEWGPGRDLAKAGIVPITHQDAVIEAEEGSAELRFKTTKSVDIIHSLHSETKAKRTCKQMSSTSKKMMNCCSVWGDIGITRLTKSKFGTWNGDVKTGEGNHELQVKAGVKKGSSSTFTPLLKYQVKETEELKREKELRRERQEISRREEEAKQEMMMKEAEEAKNELQAASKSGDAKALRNEIRKVENSNVAFLLTKEIEEAKDLLQSIERIHALKEAVLKLDRKTMVELRKYSKPPKIVLHVMKATLVLLATK